MIGHSSGIHSLSHSLQTLVRKEAGGELIRWAGMSSPRKSFLYATPIWLMGIPWTAFTVFWEAMSIGAILGIKGATKGMAAGMAWLFALFGVPFVVIGLGMLAAPFWAARQARRTAYVLTDRRLLTITDGRSIKVRSVDPRRVIAVESSRHPDGSGNLVLTLGFARDSDGDTVTNSEQLWAIPDVVRLEAMLRETGKEQR